LYQIKKNRRQKGRTKIGRREIAQLNPGGKGREGAKSREKGKENNGRGPRIWLGENSLFLKPGGCSNVGFFDFSGFKQVVQVLGKVCMYVDEDVTSIHVGHTKDGKAAVPYTTDKAGLNARKVPGVTANFYAKGNHCFTPVEALDFARQRDLLKLKDSDYGRQRHQQQLLKAIMNQAVHDGLSSPTKLPKLLSAVGKTMTVDDGGIPLEDWVFAMRGIKPDDLVTLKTNDGKFNSRQIDGVGAVEVLTPLSLQMLKAVKGDDLATFIQAHPQVVVDSKATQRNTYLKEQKKNKEGKYRVKII